MKSRWFGGGGGGSFPGGGFWAEEELEEAAEGHEVEEEEGGGDGEEGGFEGWDDEADGGHEVEEELDGEAGAVKRDAGEAEAGCEGAEEEEGAGETQVFVGEELKGEAVLPGEEPGGMAEEHLEVAGQGAGFAACLGAGIERLGIEGLGLAVVYDAVAGDGDEHGDDYVIEDGIGGDGPEEGTADGVDGAGAADAGIEVGLGLPDGGFHFPVEIDAGAGGGEGIADAKDAADSADGGFGEVAKKAGNGVGSELLAGIGEEDDGGIEGGDGIGEAGGFAAAEGKLEDACAGETGP